VKIKLDQDTVFMLYSMLKDPTLLSTPPMQPYKAQDLPAALEVVSLIQFLEKKLITLEGQKALFREWEGNLTQAAVNRLRDIVKYYEPVGTLSVNCKAYTKLVYALIGKTIDPDLVQIEEEV